MTTVPMEHRERNAIPPEGEKCDPHRAALLAGMDVLRRRLLARGARPGECSIAHREAPSAALAEPGRSAEADSTWPAPPGDSALAVLTRAFGLDAFEQSILVLCAGVELDGSFGELVSSLGGPTFGLALAALPGAHWSALQPGAPLRSWRLVHLLNEGGANEGRLTTALLRADEPVLHALVGLPFDDPALRGVLRRVGEGVDGVVPPWLQRLFGECPARASEVGALAELWMLRRGLGEGPLAQLIGADAEAMRLVATRAAALLWGGSVLEVSASGVPSAPAEREELVRRIERQAMLAGVGILVDALQDAQADAALQLASALSVPAAVMCREPHAGGRRPILPLEIERPSAEIARRAWLELVERTNLRSPAPHDADAINAELDRVTDQFRLTTIGLCGALARVETVVGGGIEESRGRGEMSAAELSALIWTACREQARAGLQDLAPRVRSTSTWEDLVLPDALVESLRAIVAHARHRRRVREQWGFARGSGRGTGTTALFAGASGTGKTLAAEIIANALQLDLHRIDLSAVVSKYIGETERNLRRVFDAAEEGGAALVFDEADALFGRRTEVRDSHDRYANLEVSYLLQRMEAYRGVAILTTNHRSAIDEAFLRRLGFVLEFPFPDQPLREELWRKAFPSQAPIDGLDWARLARLPVPGGSIVNMAQMAAVLAAADGQVIRMRHVQDAARRECAKLERHGVEAEIGGWA